MSDNLNTDGYAEQAIVQLLTAAAAPVAIAQTVADRIYPVVIPDDKPAPAIVYHQVLENTVPTADGPVADGYVFSVGAVSPSYAEAKKLTRAVRVALNGKRVTVEGIGELFIYYEKENQPEFDPDRNYYAISLDFRAS